VKSRPFSHIARAFLLAAFSTSAAHAATYAAPVTLPNGRLITPIGTTEYLGPFPFTMTMSPNGRQIIAPSIGWPYALNIISNPSSAHPTIQRIPKGNKSVPSVRVHTGVAYSPDGSLLYDATGNSGAVDIYRTSDWQRIATVSLNGNGYHQSFAASLALSPSGRELYVIDQANWRVVTISTATRRILASTPTGREPISIALSPTGKYLYVANSGLFNYKLISGLSKADPIATGLKFPPTGYPSKQARLGTTVDGHVIPPLGNENSLKGSSLFTYSLANPRHPVIVARLRLGAHIQESPGGVVGGASPTGIAVNAHHVFVSLAHDDAVAEISPDGRHLQRQIALTPFHGSSFEDSDHRPLRGIDPYGMAIHNHLLYVAESGIDAIAVINLATARVLGHIPTDWYPVAVSFSPNGKTLYVLTNKGKGAGPNYIHGHHYYIGQLEHGSLTAIPLSEIRHHLPQLTRQVIANNTAALRHATPWPNPPIRHVFLIIRENRTFDEVFGDLPGVDGDPQLARYGMHGWVPQNPSLHNLHVTPNAHALAERFATSDHFSVDSEVSADGHRWAVGMPPTPWFNIAWSTAYSSRRTGDVTSTAPGRRAIWGGADSPMPEDEPEYGSMWEHVANAHLSILNYGEGLELEGSDEAKGTAPQGQRLFLNSPLPEPVFNATDRNYPTFNLGIPDQYRFAEFKRNFTQRLASGPAPALTVIRLPNDHTADPRPADGYPYRASYVADNDLALGKIVQFISHSRIWKSSAIFVIEDDAQSGVDHVDAHRSVLLVISPWVRPGFISHDQTSMGSVLQDIYRSLHLGPDTLMDRLEAGFGDIFTTTPDFTPYTAIPADPRVFIPSKAKIAQPKTAAEARQMLDADDPALIAPEVDSSGKTRPKKQHPKSH
jgi:YVTN family beta-propeller protein